MNFMINAYHRETISLNGKWHIIIDPYEAGFFDYRYEESSNGFFKNAKPKDKSGLVEYNFDTSDTLNVPGDWNTQRESLLYYEGTIWYKTSFNHVTKPGDVHRYFLYFGGANYDTYVYLNGRKLGQHIGGFTPFSFEITDRLRDGENDVVVKVDNKRLRKGVPTVNTDWWNYGGITRRVMIVKTPSTFISDYFFQLKKGTSDTIECWLQLDGADLEQEVVVEIPEIDACQITKTDANGRAEISFKVPGLKLWRAETPELYNVVLNAGDDFLEDEIGFRSIETRGADILLNGQPIFLRGICIHEEAPFRSGRAFSHEDAVTLLSWAKEMGCNYVRLAHYPHNEEMVRLADHMGLMVWSEIPVYWTILWEREDVLQNALQQLTEMIRRDKNRACVILWSMGNETPISDARMAFFKRLIERAREMDSTRLLTAALQIHNTQSSIFTLDDPLGEYLDVLGCNTYIGWYGGRAEDAATKRWETPYHKPLIISEFGGGALSGFHGDAEERWTEEYQENIYVNHTTMFRNIPFLRGISPWILMDFRSPRRVLPGIQGGWNRKGLISDQGQKKKAFYIMRDFYVDIARNGFHPNVTKEDK
jgi:beta-glucuronidase